MALKTQIKYLGPARQKVKGFPKALKGALSGAMAKWHQGSLPLHFKKEAYSRYPLIKQRKGVIKNGRVVTVKNKPMIGWRAPMLVSGKMQAAATRSISITGSAKTMRGRLPGTNAANFFPKTDPPAPYNMREELTVVREDEERKMDAIVDEEMTAFLREQSEVETVTV